MASEAITSNELLWRQIAALNERINGLERQLSELRTKFDDVRETNNLWDGS